MGKLPKFIISSSVKGSRSRRYILAAIILLILSLVATQVFLNQTSVGSPIFVRMTFLLWTATVAVVLALLILATVLGRNLIKLYFERKSHRVGSGFKTKMVRTFVVLSLLPALLLFFLAYILISFSIEKWFSAPAAQMMSSSRSLARQYYAESEQRGKHFAGTIAAGIPSAEALSQPQLNEKLQEYLRQYALDSLQVLDEHGKLAAAAGEAIAPNDHKIQVESLITEALLGQQSFQVARVSPKDALREVTRTAVPIYSHEGTVIGAVMTETVNPQSVHFQAYSVMEAYGVYEELQRDRAALRFNILLILALSTLLIVFAFSWFGLYLAKRITVPIQALAEGAAEVAAGNLDHRVQCDALDELGSLVASFNRMTSDLQENKNRIEAAQQNLRQTNVELDERRRYIETILQTIATGVVSLDSGYRIRTMNRAAIQMLQVQGPMGESKFEEVVQGPACDTLRMLLHKSTVLGKVVRNIEVSFPGKTLHLATTVTPLTDSMGNSTGWVVVLDDVTELLRIEKMVAWQEVARRLAHEIKNPLTPIQLSAERIWNQYKHILIPAQSENVSGPRQAELTRFNHLLQECIQTIIQEAGSLKNLVDEFSRFARLPEMQLIETDLHHILENTLNLYNGRIQDVRIRKEFDSNIPRLRLDPEQIKRVFINLFDNALEAMAENSHAKILFVRTRCSAQQGCVQVEVSDTGRGFPSEYQDSLFLPYFSTRKEGTGLGLAIVRQIISDHHGTVRAETNVPVGTKIVINLPLASA